jgi:thioredoxin 1
MENIANLVQVTDENFETEVLLANVPVLVDFWAAWCGPCKMIAPLVEELATEYNGKIKVGTLDVDANPTTSMQFGVMSIPTLIVFKDGKAAQRIVGYQPKANLKQRIDQVLL